MVQKIKDAYFADQTYALIYMHHFCYRVAASAMYIFTGAYFLKIGMPLHFALLFYGLEFGLRGALCPFGLVFLNKVGLVRALFTAGFFMIIFFTGVSFSDQSLYIGFFSFVFAAMAGAIYYPFLDVLEAFYVKHDHNRGKQISLGMIAQSLGNVAGAAGIGFLLEHFGYDAVVVLVAVFLFLAVLPFLKLQALMQYLDSIKPSEVYSFLVTEEFRPLWKPFFGQQLLIIVNTVLIPIFIFTIVGAMDSLGYLIALALILEKIVALLAGHYIDKTGSARILRYSFGYYGLALLLYTTLVKTPLSAFLAETYNKIAYNAYRNAFMTGLHQKARDDFAGRILLFGAGYQMSLCFGELLVLPLYSLLSYWIGMDVFYVACAMAMVGLYMVISYFGVSE